ncbi:RNA-guided endonuclease InsQ/TnpB family protein [Mycobacterium persicum]|nr:RNA-guided endonuclease TnpB family protein [Mycobacterium persicum]
MANRYRLYPTEEQAVFMRERHCADARYVWNLAVEQFRYRERRERGTTGRSAPGPAARQKQLAQARQEFEWLRGGSSSVQQQALRDFDRAAQACFEGNAKEPTWRKRGQSEGFCIRDTKVVVHSRRWAQVAVPKLGWVKFKLSRAFPHAKLGMARITCSCTGRWHVSFPAPQPAVSDAGRAGRSIGIDRGVATTVATSDGQMFRAPRMRKREQAKLARLEREKARRRKGRNRRKATVKQIAMLHERVAERRKDWVEKITTRLAGSYDFVAVEALQTTNMVRRRKPKPDPDNPGQYLPNGAAAKAGLSKGIYANCWGMFARRLGHKMQASGTTLVAVPPKNSSIECRMCGHTATENRKSQAGFQCVACGHAEHADIQAAQIVLARARPAPTPGPGAAPQGAGTARCARESGNQGWAA